MYFHCLAGIFDPFLFSAVIFSENDIISASSGLSITQTEQQGKIVESWQHELDGT